MTHESVNRCSLGYSAWSILHFWIDYHWTVYWAIKCQLLRCRQECIPVGCALPALYRTGGLCPGGSLCRGSLSKERRGSLSRGSLARGGLCQGDPPPPVDRQTPVKLLPCPSVQGRLCPEGVSVQRGSLSRGGLCPEGVSVQRGSLSRGLSPGVR